MVIERAYALHPSSLHRAETPAVTERKLPENSSFAPTTEETESLVSGSLGLNEIPSGIQETDPGLFEKLQDGLQSFFNAVSNFGKAAGDESPGSVAAGTVCGLVTVLTLGNSEAVQKIGPAIHRAFNTFGTMLDTNADEALRKVFSGFCAFSSLLRTVNPILVEIASQTQDGVAKLIFGTAALVLQAVYVGTSFIGSVLASHDAIRDVPKQKDSASLADQLRKKLIEKFKGLFEAEDKLEYLRTLLEKQIQAQVEILKNAGTRGGLTSAREILLFAGAVLSLVAISASLPVLLIVAGGFNLFANISEIAMAVMDWTAVSIKEITLVPCKKILEDELEMLKDGDPQHAKLAKKLESVVKELKGAENDRSLALVRFVKGIVGTITAISSIVTGTLLLTLKIAVPWWPLIATVLSMICVTALGTYNLVLRCSNDRASAQAAGEQAVASAAA